VLAKHNRIKLLSTNRFVGTIEIKSQQSKFALLSKKQADP